MALFRKKVKIKYFSSDDGRYVNEVEKIVNGDWIDLRSAADVTLKAGQFKLIPLGIGMQLPKGYEAHVVPRSSTYKNFKIIQTNSMGVIDNTYCGDSDQWFFPAYALEDTEIKFNERICQFRIEKIQPKLEFERVETLGNPSRGGHGSTGTN